MNFVFHRSDLLPLTEKRFIIELVPLLNNCSDFNGHKTFPIFNMLLNYINVPYPEWIFTSLPADVVLQEHYKLKSELLKIFSLIPSSQLNNNEKELLNFLTLPSSENELKNILFLYKQITKLYFAED